MVRTACTGLPDLAWAVFEAWRAAGEPDGNAWALTRLGDLGDDGPVRRAAPLVREWIAARKHVKAGRVVEDVLARIGTGAALEQLNFMTRRSFPGGAREDARLAGSAAARRRGLTADRLVPDLGLGTDGTLTLDYGPPPVHGRFRRAARAVRDGRERRAAQDAPEAGREGRSRAGARRWTAGADAFRVAEDGAFATVQDGTYALPAEASIGIGHPLRLDVPAWSEVFADYGILQPFPRLGRPVAVPDERARAARRLVRFEGRTTSFGAVLRLARNGWERAHPLESGGEPGIFRPAGEKAHIAVELDPGIAAGEPGRLPEQRIRRVQVVTDLDAWWWRAPDAEDPAAPRLGDLDPVIVSEMLVDLATLE